MSKLIFSNETEGVRITKFDEVAGRREYLQIETWKGGIIVNGKKRITRIRTHKFSWNDMCEIAEGLVGEIWGGVVQDDTKTPRPCISDLLLMWIEIHEGAAVEMESANQWLEKNCEAE